MASELEKALAAQYGGNGPMFMPSTPVNDLYAGIYPPAAPRTNPLAPSQGGSWPQSAPQRPRSTPLTPQNYNPNIPPQNPNDPNRLASGQLPFIDYPTKPPIDITVQGAPTQTASIPLPRPRPGMNIQPWAQAENLMDPGNPGYVDPNASPVMPAYAPQPAPAPQAPAAAAASAMAQGQAPQTSWVQDLITGLGTLGGGGQEKPQTPQQAYDAANFMAQNAARNQDRSGFGTDGYVRDYFGNPIGRDAKYKGMNPDQMYNAISGRPQDDSWKTIGSADSGKPAWQKLGFGSSHEYRRAVEAYAAENGLGEEEAREALKSANRRPAMGSTGSTGGAATQPVTLGPTQAPRNTVGAVGMAGRPMTAGPTQAPRYSLASAMTRTGKKVR